MSTLIQRLVVNKEDDSVQRKVYDIIQLTAITVGIIPLMFLKQHRIFHYTEIVTTALFILDYILRWSAADRTMNKGKWSFILYPVTPMALIDLLSILPGLSLISGGFILFRVTRLMRVIRVFKFIRYSSQIQILLKVLHKERKVLFSVLVIAVFYVILTALIIYNVEPHINPETGEPTFKTFFEALYWATVTLTTVGYGDLCAVSDFGRLISMISALFGVAIIALPSGVITASYLDEIHLLREAEDKNKKAADQ